MTKSATKWNVSAALLAGQLIAESGFNPFATSPAGAEGIAQFMPGTASSYGLADPFDPVEAIDAEAHLMSDLLHQFGSPELALAAYNAGPAPVEACSCVPAIPETTAYVARIMALIGSAGALGGPDLRSPPRRMRPRINSICRDLHRILMPIGRFFMRFFTGLDRPLGVDPEWRD